MKDKIDKTIDLLNKKLNLINKDYKIVSKANRKLNKSNGVFYHNPDLITDTCNILLKNRFEDFLQFPFKEEELKRIIYLKYYKYTKSFFSEVTIRNGKLKDVNSYVRLMQRLFAPFQNMNFKKIDKELNSNYTILLNDMKNNLLRCIKIYLNKYEKNINAYEKILEKLQNVSNSLNDKETYKQACEDLFSYLKEEKIDIGELDNLKYELKKSITPKKEPEKISYSDFEDTELKKEGTRTERIKEHEKMRLKKDIIFKTKSLNDDAKQWVELIVEQLVEFEKQQIEDFKKDPYSYLPEKNEEEFYEIISLSIDKLKFADADSNIIDTLMKTIRR